MSSDLRVVQAVGLTVATLLAGAVVSISSVGIPSFQLAPAPVAARQWKAAFDRGKATAPPMAALSASTFGYLAYSFSKSSLPNDSFRVQLYLSAAVAVFYIVPYTMLMMSAVNNKLSAKVDDSSGSNVTEKVTEAGLAKGETIKELLDSWALHNAVRGLFPLTGAVLGLWATLA